MKSDETSRSRRAFFRDAFTRIAQPVAEYLDAQVGAYLPEQKPLLRPPGALPEKGFLDTCRRCGDCVEACPADAIQPMQNTTLELNGTPYIDPDAQPCVVCQDLACMAVCPSGALQKLSVAEIQIGLAAVDGDICLRSREIDCRYCVDACPIGEDAIQLNTQGEVEVFSSGCVGCGVCQYHCPTEPKSIVVRPILS